jgi:hypothetical protein
LGGTTRRQFLTRGGAFAALLAAGGTAAVLPSRGRADATVLSAARRETYTAFMETVVTGPSMRLDASVAPAAAERFAAAYSGWPPERRRDADAVLDALADVASLEPGRRGAELRARARPSTAQPGAAERARLELSVRALELAAVVLAPPDSHEIVSV